MLPRRLVLCRQVVFFLNEICGEACYGRERAPRYTLFARRRSVSMYEFRVIFVASTGDDLYFLATATLQALVCVLFRRGHFRAMSAARSSAKAVRALSISTPSAKFLRAALRASLVRNW